MWIVAIAWMYVALLMALAEATSTQGSILGAIITFVMYGVAPLALVKYLKAPPARRRVRRAAEEAQWRAQQAAEVQAAENLFKHSPPESPEVASGSTQTDAGSLPAGDGIAAERKEP